VGLTHIKVSIANPARPKRAIDLTFLVDSGAVYSVIPAALLRKLGVKPHSKRTFILADGSEITRKIGDVAFRLDGRQGAAPVARAGDLLRQRLDRLLGAVHQREEELALAREVPVDRALRQPGAVGDLVDRALVVAVLGEAGERRVEDLAPAHLRLSARRAAGRDPSLRSVHTD